MRWKKSLKNKLRKSVDQAPIFNLWPRGVSVFMASSFIKDFHIRCHYPSRMSKTGNSSKKSTEILFFVFLMSWERLIVVYQISLDHCFSFSVTSAWKSLSSLSSNMLTTHVFVDVFSNYWRWLHGTQLVRTVLYEAPRSRILKLLFCCIYTYRPMHHSRRIVRWWVIKIQCEWGWIAVNGIKLWSIDKEDT